MKVFLYKVGRNLNRAIRTCYSFGITEIILINPKQIILNNSLFSAQGKTKIEVSNNFPELDKSIALENFYKSEIYSIKDWANIENIIIGGESDSLPNLDFRYKATIPTVNKFCLTVEAALAIGLYEWSKQCYQQNY